MRYKTSRWAWVLGVFLLVGAAPVEAGSLGGIGVLGDSYSDEYAAYPPDRSQARNWVEILATLRGLDFGSYSTAGRGEPRNQGFAFNWARSDAETADLIAAGQHTGLAAQVADGRVGLVFVFIGGNDFIHALHAPDSAAALQAALPRALTHYRAAVSTILEANSEVKLVVTTVPDIRHLPEFERPLKSGELSRALADAYSAAIGRFNAQVRALAASQPRRIALLDLDATTRLASLVSRDSVLVGGRRLNRAVPGNDPDHVFLADERHLGTVAQGRLAQMFVAAVNAKFDASIPPLTDQELLDFAAAITTFGRPVVAANGGK